MVDTQKSLRNFPGVKKVKVFTDDENLDAGEQQFQTGLPKKSFGQVDREQDAATGEYDD